MQRKKWISGLCIAMAAALVFTGCGHKKSSKEEKGTTVSSGTVVMMVGDDQVRYSEVMAYCYFLKCQYEDSFGKELWQYKLDDNETIGDQAKQEIVNMITQLKVISDVAQQQEVSLSADEQDEALRQAESLVQNAKAADKKEYGSALQTEEDISITQDMIDQQKEKIIRQRQSDMFVKKYNQWLRDKKVDINQSFWNDFTL